MEYEQVLLKLAPCGLDCNRCAGYSDGEIARLSRDLLSRLGNYRRLAPIRARADYEFAGYEQFEKILNSLAGASCEGCRGVNSRCPVNCKAKSCHREKGVDFCFQCADFPCKSEMEIPTGERWRKMNQHMRDIGVEAYYEEQCKLPRY